MSTLTRRGVLAGALAIPWLTACAATTPSQAGVKMTEGTFSSRFWPGHPVRWRLDCGRQDPFIVANRAFARGLPTASATFDAGAHTEEFWGAHAGTEMSWLRRHLRWLTR